MGLAVQKELAKSDVTRDVQNGGGSEIVKLEAIILQKSSKERMDRKSDAS